MGDVDDIVLLGAISFAVASIAPEPVILGSNAPPYREICSHSGTKKKKGKHTSNNKLLHNVLHY